MEMSLTGVVCRQQAQKIPSLKDIMVLLMWGPPTMIGKSVNLSRYPLLRIRFKVIICTIARNGIGMSRFVCDIEVVIKALLESCYFIRAVSF